MTGARHHAQLFTQGLGWAPGPHASCASTLQTDPDPLYAPPLLFKPRRPLLTPFVYTWSWPRRGWNSLPRQQHVRHQTGTTINHFTGFYFLNTSFRGNWGEGGGWAQELETDLLKGLSRNWAGQTSCCCFHTIVRESQAKRRIISFACR